MKIIKYLIISGLLIFTIISCSDDQCNTDTESSLQTEILVKSSGLKAIKYLDSLSLYSPEWVDSIHYLDLDATSKSAKSFFFMLSPISDTSEIIFASKEDTVLNDTLFVFSQREHVFLSSECGFVTNFTIDTILFTTYNIDSLELVVSEISTTKDGHVKIYF